ncbi:uncharacterized protein [Diadema setosum]|uniref:uncharacterized protein n=1 Tax=Diadema setosum TaxID=31175 RepID=UPI003B3A2EEE
MGAVRQVRCDQGTNFIAARNEFQAALNELDKNIEMYLADRQCEFVFNVPQSSHAGGVWERQIRTIRSILKATIDTCPGRLTDSALRTFLYEAMAIVYSRPLTMVNMNDPRADSPLTPNNLLTMKGKVPLPPPGQFPPVDMYTKRTWRLVQSWLEQFWSRWKKEISPQSATKGKKWTKPRRNLQVGDIVLVTDHETPRMQWPLAMVTSANPDDDCLVRQVQVRVGVKSLNRRGCPS